MPLLLEQKEGESVLKALGRENIFVVSPNGDMFEFTEACDDYFTRILNKDQVLALANELRELATPTNTDGE